MATEITYAHAMANLNALLDEAVDLGAGLCSFE
jgi:hypothetical protein